VERINPTGDVRIALLTYYVTVYRPAQTIDVELGGLVPGDPVLVCQMFAGIEPILGRPLLEQLGDAQLTNRIDHRVTCWYRKELTVAMFIEFDDETMKRHLEILNIRDRGLGHRYQELYCQERVS